MKSQSRGVPDGYREAAGAIIRDEQGRVLFVRRSPMETSMHGMWELPGGKVEGGEHPEETAAIEAMEEVGLSLNRLKHMGSHVDDNKSKVFHGYETTLGPDVDPNSVQLSEEHNEFRWVHPEDIGNFLDDGGLSHHAEYLFGPDNPGGADGNHPDDPYQDYSTWGDVVKMAQMQVTPEDYDEFGERFRMNRLDQILAPDPAQNLTGVNVPRRSGLQQNMYLPMQTDVPLSEDTLSQLRNEGFTVTNRVLDDGGRRYGFRTKANPIDYEDATGNLGTDFDQRSRQPLDVRGQLESSAALARRGAFAADNEYAHDEYYEPRPESVRPEREQLMRLLHGASDEQVQSILDADQARTARAIGATRGMRGGKYGSEFARRQAEDLFEEKVAGPDREAAMQERARAAEQRRAEQRARMAEEQRRREEYLQSDEYKEKVAREKQLQEEEEERKAEEEREKIRAWRESPEGQKAIAAREEKQRALKEAEAEKQRRRAEERGTIGVRKPSRRKFATRRGGRR